MNDHKGLLGLLSTCLKSYGAAASTRKKERKKKRVEIFVHFVHSGKTC